MEGNERVGGTIQRVVQEVVHIVGKEDTVDQDLMIVVIVFKAKNLIHVHNGHMINIALLHLQVVLLGKLRMTIDHQAHNGLARQEGLQL